MKIEILYPEICNLFGDLGNMRYLSYCLPDADFITTSFGTEPLFASQVPDLIYMGPTTEKNQEKILTQLSPYRVRLKELIEADVPMLFTGNAGELLFNEIEDWDGRKIPGLGLLPFTAKRSHYDRFNGLVLGDFQGKFDILGFRTQFTFWYGDNTSCPFVTCKRGIGLNRESNKEGILNHHLIVTSQIGPLLINNPNLTRYLLDTIGASDAPLAFEKEVRSAYNNRLQDFTNPKTKFEQ